MNVFNYKVFVNLHFHHNVLLLPILTGALDKLF